MTASAPVGVFDSGIGGLTVARRITELLPRESILYVGDTARIPYGPKSPETVRDFAMQIGSYLVAAGVKAVVIACNTATACGLSTLAAALSVPVLGVIAPGARAAVALTRSGRIGVIGTRGTISSEAYQSAILALRQDARVHAAAAPLLVPLVEEGHLDDELTALALRLYLDPLLENAIDTLVLGCTHYPLLEPVITRHVGVGVRVIDSAGATAIALKELLEENGTAATEGVGRIRYFATDHPEGFRTQGRRFLGRALRAVQLLAIDELEDYRR